jgi:predicted Fe-Mo cluster-binding NifX family protein
LKVAVTAMEKNLNSKVSPVFGRSPDFIVVDLEEDEIKGVFAIENPAKYEKGAGNMAAQFMVDHDINVVISGEMGPVAFHILKNAGIKVYKIASVNVEKNLRRLKEGNLNEITSLSSGYPK